MILNRSDCVCWLAVCVSLCFLGGCGNADKKETSKTSGEPEKQKSAEVELFTQIVSGKAGPTDMPEEWGVVESDEFQCMIAWPESLELSEASVAEFEDGEFTFVFASSERTEEHQNDYTFEAVANLTEAGMRVGDEKILSETSETPVFLRQLVNRGDDYTQIGRIYVTEARFWVVAVTFPNGRQEDSRIKYFFEQFKLNTP